MGNTGVYIKDTVATTLKSKETIALDAPCIKLDGCIKATTIIAKYIQSEDYTTGDFGSQYKNASHNLSDGSGDTGGNSPDHGSGGKNNRHCSAWEQVAPALNTICDMLVCICAEVGCQDLTDQVRALAASSKMPRNRGL